MSFNINVDNTQITAVVDSIRSINPDLVLVIEVSPIVMLDLDAGLKNTLPYNFRSPGGGLGIFSKLPLESSRGEKLDRKSVV